MMFEFVQKLFVRYDILIDDKSRPWLIEVNACPSLARPNVLDKYVKNRVTGIIF